MGLRKFRDTSISKLLKNNEVIALTKEDRKGATLLRKELRKIQKEIHSVTGKYGYKNNIFTSMSIDGGKYRVNFDRRTYEIVNKKGRLNEADIRNLLTKYANITSRFDEITPKNVRKIAESWWNRNTLGSHLENRRSRKGNALKPSTLFNRPTYDSLLDKSKEYIKQRLKGTIWEDAPASDLAILQRFDANYQHTMIDAQIDEYNAELIKQGLDSKQRAAMIREFFYGY